MGEPFEGKGCRRCGSTRTRWVAARPPHKMRSECSKCGGFLRWVGAAELDRVDDDPVTAVGGGVEGDDFGDAAVASTG